MNFLPHSLVLAGLLFLLAGVWRFLDRKGFAAPDARVRTSRRRAHWFLFGIGFLLVWVGFFLIVRGLH